MARVEPYYRVSFVPVVSGLSVALPVWRFTCGAVDPSDPAAINVDLPAGTITFQQSAFEQFGELYMTPVKTVSVEFSAGSNYYLDMRTNDPANPVQSNPPTEKFAGEIISPIVADIRIPANSLIAEITVRDQNPGPIFDLRRDVVIGTKRVKAYVVGQQPAGAELLDTVKHATLFPVSLGRLKTNEQWFVENVI